MKHKKAAVCCLILMMAAALFAEDWVLAAEAFSGDEAAGTLLPSLILDAIPTSLVRTVSDEEQVFRQLLVLEKDRKSHADKLDTLIKERDTVIFTTQDTLTRRDKIAEYETKIAAEKAALSEADERCRTLEEGGIEFDRLEEKVVLWRNNTAALYSRSGTDEPTDIRALITGSVQVRNGFLYVRAGLVIFPGTITCNEIVVAGELTDTAAIAQEVASALVDTIVNATPVSLSFSIGPAAALKSVEVTIDGMNVQNPENPHAFQSGIHTVSITADGYEKQTFTRDFSDAPRYQIDVMLPELKPVNLELTALTEKGAPVSDAQVWVAGRNAGFAPVSVSVNGRQVLGVMQETDGVLTYFALENTGTDAVAAVRLRTESSQSRIEKSRKSLYTAYGLLLLTLPFSFYFYGRMEDAYTAYSTGLQTASTAEEFYKWQRLERISMCVSITAGANMIYRLVRYMLAADSVLPEVAEPEGEQ